MASPRPMRDFGLEVYFSKWEFAAEHHMTASDIESMAVSDLLSMASTEDRDAYETLGLGYTETWGAPALREEIAGTYARMAPENILCLAGAGEGLYAVAKVLLSGDDHVIVPTPNYQGAETIPLSICETTGVPLRRDPGETGQNSAARGGWRLDIDDLKVAVKPNTKLLSLNFPHNPTGLLLPEEDLTAIVDFCRQRGIYILSDEVYRGVELDLSDQMPQIADIYERGISLNVMSKAYGMPGLRVGWIASQDKDLLQRVERYKHYLSICNSGPSEILAQIALKARDTILNRNRNLIQRNVVQLEELLTDFPGLIEWQRPMGGCVAFPRYTGPGDSEEFCRKLIEESSVLLLPASIYKSDLAEVPQDHFRIGVGRDQVFQDGLAAMRRHFEKNYPEFKS